VTPPPRLLSLYPILPPTASSVGEPPGGGGGEPWAAAPDPPQVAPAPARPTSSPRRRARGQADPRRGRAQDQGERRIALVAGFCGTNDKWLELSWAQRRPVRRGGKLQQAALVQLVAVGRRIWPQIHVRVGDPAGEVRA
jgi:hypothetical protein